MLKDVCWSCGEPYKREQSMVCSFCGKHRRTEIKNACENPACTEYGKQLAETERYCDLCTKPTTIGRQVEEALGH